MLETENMSTFAIFACTNGENSALHESLLSEIKQIVINGYHQTKWDDEIVVNILEYANSKWMRIDGYGYNHLLDLQKLSDDLNLEILLLDYFDEKLPSFAFFHYNNGMYVRSFEVQLDNITDEPHTIRESGERESWETVIVDFQSLKSAFQSACKNYKFPVDLQTLNVDRPISSLSLSFPSKRRLHTKLWQNIKYFIRGGCVFTSKK